MHGPGHQGPHGLRVLDGELQQGLRGGRVPHGPPGAVALRLRRRFRRPFQQGRDQGDWREGRAAGERPQSDGLCLRAHVGILRPLPEHGHSVRREAGHSQRGPRHRPGRGRREDPRRGHRRGHGVQLHLHDGHARSGPGASHVRGGEGVQLPPVAARILGAVLHGRLLARFQAHRLPEGDTHLPAACQALRETIP